MKKIIPKKYISRLTPVHVKMNDEQKKKIDKKAKEWTQGNASAWLRHAGLMYVPQPGERIQLMLSRKHTLKAKVKAKR